MLKIIIINIAILCIFATGQYQDINIEEYLSNAANDGVYSAARLKVDQTVPQEFTFLSVQKIERQIVAGYNYKFFLLYGNENQQNTYSIRVYQDLKNNLQVYDPELIQPEGDL